MFAANLGFMLLCVTNPQNSGLFYQEHFDMKPKEVLMNHENHIPQYLYKIVSPEEWEDSVLKNQVVTSPLDKNFIHLATENQLSHVAQKFWSGKSCVILKIDSKKIKGRLVYENNPGGTTQYYHLYEGTIPLEAVEDSLIFL